MSSLEGLYGACSEIEVALDCLFRKQGYRPAYADNSLAKIRAAIGDGLFPKPAESASALREETTAPELAHANVVSRLVAADIEILELKAQLAAKEIALQVAERCVEECDEAVAQLATERERSGSLQVLVHQYLADLATLKEERGVERERADDYKKRWDTATSDAVSNGVRAEKSVAEAKALREAIIESLTEIDRQTGEICPLCSEERPSHQDHCPVITLNTALLLREDKQDAPHA